MICLFNSPTIRNIGACVVKLTIMHISGFKKLELTINSAENLKWVSLKATLFPFFEGNFHTIFLIQVYRRFFSLCFLSSSFAIGPNMDFCVEGKWVKSPMF